jgi:hypothetical protein
VGGYYLNSAPDLGIITDGFVKSSSAALRFIFRHSDVLQVRLIPKDSRALHLKLFTVPSIS